MSTNDSKNKKKVLSYLSRENAAHANNWGIHFDTCSSKEHSKVKNWEIERPKILFGQVSIRILLVLSQETRRPSLMTQCEATVFLWVH